MISHSATPGKHLSPHHAPPHGDGHHRLLVIIAATLGAALALGMVVLTLKPRPDITTVSPEAFVAQLEQAAGGAAIPVSVYGGTIRVERKGNQATVHADGVPPNICVSVGWKLVRKGLLSINGTTPLRVSAAKLSELCNQDEGAATLAWTPRTPE